ncbi:hypothetical protein BD769DRAFT_1387645 [Suillus cothurnatus]|nr:hypothetical protein BD769DRAFT_1387645 [Suillus cothurnatus]
MQLTNQFRGMVVTCVGGSGGLYDSLLSETLTEIDVQVNRIANCFCLWVWDGFPWAPSTLAIHGLRLYEDWLISAPNQELFLHTMHSNVVFEGCGLNNAPPKCTRLLEQAVVCIPRFLCWFMGGLNHVSAVYSQIINTQSRLPGDDVRIITIITRAAAAQRGLNIRYPDGMIYHQPGRMPQAVGGEQKHMVTFLMAASSV